jgi:hypothetical protein
LVKRPRQAGSAAITLIGRRLAPSSIGNPDLGADLKERIEVRSSHEKGSAPSLFA